MSKTKKITLNIPIAIDLTDSFMQGMDDFVAQCLQDLLDNVLEEGHTDKEIGRVTCCWTTSVTDMSDRVQLEMAEARVLLHFYFAAKQSHGKPQADKFLAAQLLKLEKLYGKSSDVRIKQYMRYVKDTETFYEE